MIPQEEILKNLVKQIDNSAPSKVLHQTEDTVDEVLFESHIDGTCYYLVRSRPRDNHPPLLSPREREITKLVALGLDNKSIGKKLGITHWTVATYLRRIFSKLGVCSRTAMIARLLEENLLSQ
ncbi:MAG TPA: helix-turn-helix transcriptional regulator [Cyanobacteria bacterium UBA11369]|nr:helix-turn-helix transcriptional regulator [Cyanobacteria bacterium UBA11371]HBE33112.1 helix-turn-helix transcriptional regulator [Cyanobacteria bacterium UBA11368]HBE50241.1 helix-turn-helix transcriptional regulator [Cyanobacteria bacterium UBA11369]